MERLSFGELPDAAAELEDLLQYNGFFYHRNENRFSLLFEDSGRKWETVCICRGSLLLIYGRFPFSVRNYGQVRAFCEDVNRQVVSGSMFLLEERVVFRTSADLFDAYTAHEQIGRAMEYNANVITRFWTQIVSCSAANSGDLGMTPASE